MPLGVLMANNGFLYTLDISNDDMTSEKYKSF